MTDTRIVYGAACVWWDSIQNAAVNPLGIPCCPHCHSVLYEIDNIEKWWEGVGDFELKGHVGYRKLVEWQRGKCFKSMAEAKIAYDRV